MLMKDMDNVAIEVNKPANGLYTFSQGRREGGGGVACLSKNLRLSVGCALYAHDIYPHFAKIQTFFMCHALLFENGGYTDLFLTNQLRINTKVGGGLGLVHPSYPVMNDGTFKNPNDAVSEVSISRLFPSVFLHKKNPFRMLFSTCEV